MRNAQTDDVDSCATLHSGHLHLQQRALEPHLHAELSSVGRNYRFAGDTSLSAPIRLLCCLIANRRCGFSGVDNSDGYSQWRAVPSRCAADLQRGIQQCARHRSRATASSWLTTSCFLRCTVRGGVLTASEIWQPRFVSAVVVPCLLTQLALPQVMMSARRFWSASLWPTRPRSMQSRRKSTAGNSWHATHVCTLFLHLVRVADCVTLLQWATV